MHKKSIVHCDIKPKNIVSPDQFGTTLVFKNFDSAVKAGEISLGGSSKYYSPELINLKKENKKRSFEDDIWAYGLTLLDIETDGPKFNNNMKKNCFKVSMTHECINTLFENIDKIIEKRYKNHTLDQCYYTGVSLFVGILRKTLKVNPKERITAEEMVKEFEKVIQACEVYEPCENTMNYETFIENIGFTSFTKKKIVNEEETYDPKKQILSMFIPSYALQHKYKFGYTTKSDTEWQQQKEGNAENVID